MKKLVMTATLTLIGSLSAALYASTVAGSRITPPTIPVDQREKSDVQVDLTEKIRALDSADPRVRAAAACALRSAGKSAAAAIPALVKMLADDTPVGSIDCEREGSWRRGDGNVEDNSPGKQAALALAEIGDEAIEPLINNLRQPDLHARKNSAFALGLIKNPHTVEPLIDSLRDASWQVRSQAAWGLGLKHDQRVVEPLVTALKDGDWQVREQASWALGLQGDKRSVEPLSTALTDVNDQVRSQAAWALGLKGDSNSVEPLMSALRDQSARVRSQAAWALGLKGDKRAVDSLTGALKDGDANVRSQAAWALGLKGDHRAVEALNAAMKDDDKQVRRQATWALGMILMRDPRAADSKIDIKLNKDGN
ncbi:MAG TPA: HEAT repeat domain-containing protein [Blastocatellia bacterium]|nr:HEAT repeat domain-containing protein [Blastocatellia bacterium]